MKIEFWGTSEIPIMNFTNFLEFFKNSRIKTKIKFINATNLRKKCTWKIKKQHLVKTEIQKDFIFDEFF